MSNQFIEVNVTNEEHKGKRTVYKGNVLLVEESLIPNTTILHIKDLGKLYIDESYDSFLSRIGTDTLE